MNTRLWVTTQVGFSPRISDFRVQTTAFQLHTERLKIGVEVIHGAMQVDPEFTSLVFACRRVVQNKRLLQKPGSTTTQKH